MVFGGPVPRQQVFDSFDRVICDAGEHVAEIRLGINVVELGSVDQGVHRGGMLATAVGAGKQPVLAALGDAAHGALGDIAVDLEPTIVEVAAECGPACQGIAHRPVHTHRERPPMTRETYAILLRRSTRLFKFLALIDASAVGFLLPILASSPTRADGGAGGNFGGNAGGSGGAGFTGSNGSNGAAGLGGGGGGGAGGGRGGDGTTPGGAGGSQLHPNGSPGISNVAPGGGGAGGGGFNGNGLGTPTITNTGVMKGGDGGPGGGGGTSGAGGGGGAGGYGAVITGNGLSNNSGMISGGTGGSGGNANDSGHTSGSGGDGGTGVQFVTPSASFTNSGTVKGGLGGAVGAFFTGASPGTNGAGGAGIVGSGLTVNNSGTINGGMGGIVAPLSLFPGAGFGAGGIGLGGSGVTVINSGAIAGGLGGDGVTRANAIAFTGGVNTLELQPSSVITGNVVAFSFTDTLRLGGSGSASLDVSTIGPAAQYQGFGVFAKTGTSTWTLSGTNPSAMSWTVSAGTLNANASMPNANFVVSSGGTLGGGGTIGGLTINGGTLSSGNSIGTLTVTGNFVQSGGTYIVETTSAGQSNRVAVGGKATISGGAVQVLAQSGSYARNTSYTILTAAGGVSGAYSSVSSNFAFLTPTLTVDANNVYLLLMQGNNSFAAGARTANQYAVGLALDQANPPAMGDFGNVLNAIGVLDTTQGPAALDAISGQNYSGFSSSMVQGAQLFMNNFLSQGGGGSINSNKVTLAEACDVACDGAVPARWGAWGGLLGGTGTIAGNGNAGTLTYNAGGFAAGLDRRLGDNFRAGVTVGYTSGQQWVGGFDGKGISNTVTAGLYGGYAQGPVYVDGIAGYAYSGNQMWRNIAIPGLQPRTAQGLTGANQVFGLIESGYRFDFGGAPAAFVTPFVRLQGFIGIQNAFTETGVQSLNLNVAAQTTNSLRSVLGARMGGEIDLGWREKLHAQVRLGWSHEYAGTDRPVTASFAGAPTIPFTTYGASPQRDGVVIGFTAKTAIAEATSLYLLYEGDISGQDSSHALTAGVRMNW